MSKFTEQHQHGVEAFTESLTHKDETCNQCGFHDAVLGGEWKTHVESDPRSGHIQYRLTCPDCQTETVLDIDI